MTWPTLVVSKSQVNRAGDILRNWEGATSDEIYEAVEVVDNWRLCHGYPINTFQATLRNKLKSLAQKAIVAQRLKRMPSIVGKLRRYESMQLARMQDIGGLRAVVSTLSKVRSLENNYRERSQFKHELAACRDYISKPKDSGYRSVHLVYKYNNKQVPEYNGLNIELQIRTRLQHAWASAVETLGTFLKHAFKSSEGPEIWLGFFALTGSAFAHLENTTPVPGYENMTKEQTFSAVATEARVLRVRDKLRGFRVAAERIHEDRRSGSYHLIVLNLTERRVLTRSYSQSNLEYASQDYSDVERRIEKGEQLQAVLVSAGHVDNLRRAYASFFLDTTEFIGRLDSIEKYLTKNSVKV